MRHIFSTFIVSAVALCSSLSFAAEDNFLNRIYNQLSTVSRVSLQTDDGLTLTLERVTQDNYRIFGDYFQQESRFQRALEDYCSCITVPTHLETIQNTLSPVQVSREALDGFCDANYKTIVAIRDPISASLMFVNPDNYNSMVIPHPFPELYVARILDQGVTVMSVLVGVSPDRTTQAQVGVFRSMSDMLRRQILGLQDRRGLSMRLHEFTMNALGTRFVLVRPLPTMGDILVRNGFREVSNEQAVAAVGAENLAFNDRFFCLSLRFVMFDRMWNQTPNTLQDNPLQIERRIAPPTLNTSNAVRTFVLAMILFSSWSYFGS